MQPSSEVHAKYRVHLRLSTAAYLIKYLVRAVGADGRSRGQETDPESGPHFEKEMIQMQDMPRKKPVGRELTADCSAQVQVSSSLATREFSWFNSATRGRRCSGSCSTFKTFSSRRAERPWTRVPVCCIPVAFRFFPTFAVDPMKR